MINMSIGVRSSASKEINRMFFFSKSMHLFRTAFVLNISCSGCFGCLRLDQHLDLFFLFFMSSGVGMFRWMAPRNWNELKAMEPPAQTIFMRKYVREFTLPAAMKIFHRLILSIAIPAIQMHPLAFITALWMNAIKLLNTFATVKSLNSKLFHCFFRHKSKEANKSL